MSPELVDAVLAYAHHLGVGLLVAVLAAETALCREGVGAKGVIRLARIDIGYGIAAAVILIAGTLRVFYGVRGSEYYLDYPMFWFKIGLFALVGLASIPPTLKYIRWARAGRAESGFQPLAKELKMVQMHLRLQWALVLLIPLVAVLMARGFGL